MANQINSNGSFTIGDFASVIGTFTLNTNIQMTGSNLTLDVPTINSGSWQSLKTSSLTNMRYAVFLNQGTGSIVLAASNVGAGMQITMQPGDFCVLPYSTSIVPQLWAQSNLASTGSLLQYGIAEA